MLIGFRKIAEYREIGADPEYREYIGRTKSKILPIVYLLVIDEEIHYVGETRRGYSRPLSYHKNDVMHRQKKGIEDALLDGKIVEVFAIEVPNVMVEFNGSELECYVAQDYEKFLIKEHQPEWNGRS